MPRARPTPILLLVGRVGRPITDRDAPLGVGLVFARTQAQRLHRAGVVAVCARARLYTWGGSLGSQGYSLGTEGCSLGM